jgi:hypothetical protein
MLLGSPFSKEFGGQTSNDEDWLKLTITGKDAAGNITGTIDFYLADFRFADNTKDYLLDSWAFVSLRALGPVKSLEFSLASSDVGAFGMNTPAYFCLDTLRAGPSAAIRRSTATSIPSAERTPLRRTPMRSSILSSAVGPIA